MSKELFVTDFEEIIDVKTSVIVKNYFSGEIKYNQLLKSKNMTISFYGEFILSKIIKLILILFLALFLILVSFEVGMVLNVIVFTFGMLLIFVITYVIINYLLNWYLIKIKHKNRLIQLALKKGNIKELLLLKTSVSFIIDDIHTYRIKKIDKFSKLGLTQKIKISKGQKITLFINSDSYTSQWNMRVPNLLEFPHQIRKIVFSIN